MKNIIIVGDERFPLPLGSECMNKATVSGNAAESVSKITSLTCSSDGITAYFSTSSLEISTVSLTQTPNVPENPAIPLNSQFLNPGQRIFTTEHLPEHDALFVATEDGELILVFESGAFESVGYLDGGLCACSWSPDGELVAIVTRVGRLLLMTSAWEVLSEVELHQEQNKATKIPADETLPAGSVRVSWRGDGRYFATLSPENTPDKVNQSQRMRIWERDGCVLHACPDPILSPHSALSWRPSGAFIATAGGHSPPSIFLFERNGLPRGEFPLAGDFPGSGAEVAHLDWSSDSELLAVAVKCSSFEAVQVWYRSNYHWYQKWEQRYPAGTHLNLKWDPVLPLRLLIWTTSLPGVMQRVDLAWESSVPPGSTLAAAMDGPDLRISDLSKGLLPPPMAHVLLRQRGPGTPRGRPCIKHFVVGRGPSGVALLSDGCLAVIGSIFAGDSAEEEGEWGEQVQYMSAVLEVSGKVPPMVNARQLAWVADRVVLALVQEPAGGSCLVEIQLAEGLAQAMNVARVPGQIPPVRLIQGTEECRERGLAWLELSSGTVLEYRQGHGLSPGPSGPQGTVPGFPELCSLGTVLWTESGPSFIGLTARGTLYIDRQVAARDCSSFVLHTRPKDTFPEPSTISHLAYTQRDALHVVPLPLKGSPTGSPAPPLPVWERGSLLVTAVGLGLVLQTPRGNLETVYPRVLVLAQLDLLLERRLFWEALGLARRHRLDLGTIVDWGGPEGGWKGWFLPCAGDFFRDLVTKGGEEKGLAMISELVCALRGGGDRVRAVCEALRAQIQGTKPGTGLGTGLGTVERARLLCELTLLAKSDPPLLEQALDLVPKGDQSGDETGEVMRHLMWVAGGDQVYRAALGRYDLSLAALVGDNHPGMDPGEYLADLEELEKLPEAYRRYRIDLQLGDLNRALGNLARAGGDHFGEFMRLLPRGEGLWEEASRILEASGLRARRACVLADWGRHLANNERLEEAAAVFLAAANDSFLASGELPGGGVEAVEGGDMVTAAVGAYRGAGRWREVMALVTGSGQGRKKRLAAGECRSLAQEMRDELAAMGRPGEAARLARDYLGDLPGGVVLLVEGKEWLEALRWSGLGTLSGDYSGDSLVESAVAIAAMECARSHVTDNEEASKKVGQYLERFEKLRAAREAMAAKLLDSEAREYEDDDMASLASSAVSGLSLYTRGDGSTGTSSVVSKKSLSAAKRAAKKATKKANKIRPGSPGESLALSEHIKNLGPTDGQRRETRELLEALVILGQEPLARSVQRSLQSLEVCHLAAVERLRSYEAEDSKAAPAGDATSSKKKEAAEESLPWSLTLLN